eukprot:s6062_g3.t1
MQLAHPAAILCLPCKSVLRDAFPSLAYLNMKLASSMQKTSALEKHFHTKHPLRMFYRDVLDEVEGCKGYFDLSAVWARLAPSGNVYRLCALQEVRLGHCADLQSQLRELAEEFGETLGGTSEERYNLLIASLKEAKAHGVSVCSISAASPVGPCSTRLARPVQVDLDEAYEQAEKGWELDSFKTTGYPPLEEFLVGNVRRGLFVVPTEPGAWKDWCTSKLVGCMVAVVQILGPVMVVLSLWQELKYRDRGADPTNYLQHPLETVKRISVNNVFCVERDMGEWCTILMGVVFSFFVVVQLLNYAHEELEDAYKFGRLAGCASFWAFAGGYINAWCVMWNILVIPVSFWKLTHASQVVLNAMTILFMFNLDDLAGTAGAVLGTSWEQDGWKDTGGVEAKAEWLVEANMQADYGSASLARKSSDPESGRIHGNSALLTAGLLIADVVGAGVLAMGQAVAKLGWLLGTICILAMLAMNAHIMILVWRAACLHL